MILLHQPAVTQCLCPLDSVSTVILTSHPLCFHFPSSTLSPLTGSVISSPNSSHRSIPRITYCHIIHPRKQVRLSFFCSKPSAASCCPPHSVICHCILSTLWSPTSAFPNISSSGPHYIVSCYFLPSTPYS